jgi:hypothetical protein
MSFFILPAISLIIKYNVEKNNIWMKLLSVSADEKSDCIISRIQSICNREHLANPLKKYFPPATSISDTGTTVCYLQFALFFKNKLPCVFFFLWFVYKTTWEQRINKGENNRVVCLL